MSNWIENDLFELNKKHFDMLLEFRIPAIRWRRFISEEKAHRVADRLGDTAFRNYDHLNDIPVDQLGVCHNQYASDPKSEYFGRIEEVQKAVDQIYDGIMGNPVQEVARAVATKCEREVSTFEEPGYGRYFAGAFRSFRGHGRLHVDCAPLHIATDWAVTRISSQLTWNLYFNVPETGGELVIHDTVHTPENDGMRVEGDYYFPDEVLDPDCQSLRVQPGVGDLIIFNTQNFHEILGTPDVARISQTSFMGIKPDGSVGLWS